MQQAVRRRRSPRKKRRRKKRRNMMRKRRRKMMTGPPRNPATVASFWMRLVCHGAVVLSRGWTSTLSPVS